MAGRREAETRGHALVTWPHLAGSGAALQSWGQPRQRFCALDFMRVQISGLSPNPAASPFGAAKAVAATLVCQHRRSGRRPGSLASATAAGLAGLGRRRRPARRRRRPRPDRREAPARPPIRGV